MKLFIRAQVIGLSVFGFTVAVALLIFNNQFFDFLGITVSENYALNQIKASWWSLDISWCCTTSLAKNTR